MRESGGLPGRVHDAALGFVRQRAAARVGAAAQRADETQQAFGAARHDLRDTVAELGEVRDRMAALPAGVCPWKGLVAYDVEDAPWFSGRERLVAELAGPHCLGSGWSRWSAHPGAASHRSCALAWSPRWRLVSLPGSETWVRLVMRSRTAPDARAGADRPARD